MLSARISSLCVCSVRASVPYVYAQCANQFLMCMLSARISSLCVCSVHASAPDVYAQSAHQLLMCMLSARISSKCLKGPLLSARINIFARSHFLPMALEGICPIKIITSRAL
jgi:hypothetical protein